MKSQPVNSQTETAQRDPEEAGKSTMRAAVIEAPRQAKVIDVQRPEPGPGEVRIRLEGCGVCASNLPVWEGREWFDYPQEPGKPGHEGWGRIEAVGEGVDSVGVGDRVTTISQHAYAECDVVPADTVVVLPESLADIPFPGEPLGCAMNVFRRTGIEEADTVAIVGIGFLGVLVTALAAEAGARVIAITRRDFALDLARRYGAAETVKMDDHWRVIEEVQKLTDQQNCDVVVEAVGYQWPLDLASELTKVRGRLIIAGYHQDGPRQVNMQQWNWRGLDVINAHERDPQVYIDGMKAAVQAVESGRIDPRPLFTHRFGLEDLAQAMQIMKERPDGFMKAMITC